MDRGCPLGATSRHRSAPASPRRKIRRHGRRTCSRHRARKRPPLLMGRPYRLLRTRHRGHRMLLNASSSSQPRRIRSNLAGRLLEGPARSDRASRAIWAPGRACSAVRGDTRRTTLWLALAMPRRPWPGLRWKIEPFPSFSPFLPTHQELLQTVSNDHLKFKHSFMTKK